jgi:hypothetical protein
MSSNCRKNGVTCLCPSWMENPIRWTYARELEHLQEQINERDVDRVVDSVLNDVLNNDVSELEPCASGREGNHPRRFGEMVGGGRYDNLPHSDSLSLPNFPTQDYTPICEVV